MIAGPPLPAGLPSLLDAFRQHAASRPEKDAMRFRATGEAVTSRIRYAALLRDAEQVAAGLVARGHVGRTLVLALPPGIAFVTAFMACLRAGVIAVPVPFPPMAQTRDRLRAVIADAGAVAVLVEAACLRAPPSELAGLRLLALEDLPEDPALPADPTPSAPAFIQYSSGSTREPSGIVITHANLAANAEMLRLALGLTPDYASVNWLPPSHDMGLVAGVLLPLYFGGTAVLMPPFAFLQRPLRWLRALAAEPVSGAASPNFGYELCTRRVPAEAIRELDLRSWKLAVCAAEPIRLPSLRRFAAHLAPAGFDPAALVACYGLAEATLLATAGPLREAAWRGHGLAFSRASCGRPAPGCTVAIRPLDDATDGAGEIMLAGPHISPGLWSGAEGRVLPFPGSTADAAGQRFVPSGDLGAIVDGELVVLDRIKDVMILHGRKIHATEVEHAALDALDGAVLAAAAFALPGDAEERVVLLCELDQRALTTDAQARLTRGLREAIGAAVGITPEIGFLRRGALPRTTSGKIRRRAAREVYLAGRLAPLPSEALLSC